MRSCCTQSELSNSSLSAHTRPFQYFYTLTVKIHFRKDVCCKQSISFTSLPSHWSSLCLVEVKVWEVIGCHGGSNESHKFQLCCFRDETEHKIRVSGQCLCITNMHCDQKPETPQKQDQCQRQRLSHMKQISRLDFALYYQYTIITVSCVLKS